MSPGSIDAVILAGGLGTRLREVLPDLPKPLAPIGGKPFLDLVLQSLAGCSRIGKVVLAVGYMAGKVVEAYSERSDFPFRILFSREDEPLGTGGAIRKALDLAVTEEVLALNGDTFVEVDWDELLKHHGRSGGAMTVVLRTANDPSRFGSVVLGVDGKVIRFEEKGKEEGASLVNAGVYLFRRSLFDGIDSGRPASLERDLIPRFLERGVYGFVARGKFIDIGIPEDYRIAREYLGEG